MRPITFMQTLRDETLRTELGAQVVAHLAAENVELTTPDRQQAVRRTVIQRRA